MLNQIAFLLITIFSILYTDFLFPPLAALRKPAPLGIVYHLVLLLLFDMVIAKSSIVGEKITVG
jgi:hypothetical protein